MKRLTVCFVVVVLFVAAGHVQAQGTIKFHKDFPKPGEKAGEILVEGSFTVDAGWALVPLKDGKSLIAKVWVTGGTGAEEYLSITPDTMKWPKTPIKNLTPGASYNVIVELYLKQTTGTGTAVVVTRPASTPAKMARAQLLPAPLFAANIEKTGMQRTAEPRWLMSTRSARWIEAGFGDEKFARLLTN